MENLSCQRLSIFLSGLILILSSCVTKQEEQFADIATVDWKDGVDSRVLGKADLSDLAFYAFSQVNVDQYDPQVMQLKPDMNIRVWQRFRRHGTELSHYNQESIKSYKDASVLFVGGTTSSALFSEEDGFLENVSIDSYGKPVVHQYFDHDLSRGNLANPSYRDYLLKISKMQIDFGVDGLFFDEVNASYQGLSLDGNEGFDVFHLEAFNRYLCEVFSGLTKAEVNEKISAPVENQLDCKAKYLDPENNFNYREYLFKYDFLDRPMSKKNPLARLWGGTLINRPRPYNSNFIEHNVTQYWQEMVLSLREYARKKYNKEILITSNGIFPFVDFQSVGLYAYNKDRFGAEENYIPVVRGRLNGRVSLLDAFKRLKLDSRKVSGDAPVVVFIDWPGQYIDRFYAFTPKEREDYFRIFGSEVYAAGLFFALPLRTSMPDDPTATDLGLMKFFKHFGEYFRKHKDIYAGTVVSDYLVKTSSKSVSSSVTQLADGRYVVHLINHKYAGRIVPQQNLKVQVEIPGFGGQNAKVISHDFDEIKKVSFTENNQVLSADIELLDSYLAIVLDKNHK